MTVVGIGGIFFKARDPEALNAWYAKHLGIDAAEGFVQFTDGGPVVWSTFEKGAENFEPQGREFMVNYRVSDLDALLERLRAAGVWIDERRDDSEYGKFAWIADPEGNRIELYEPS